MKSLPKYQQQIHHCNTKDDALVFLEAIIRAKIINVKLKIKGVAARAMQKILNEYFGYLQQKQLERLKQDMET